MAFEEWLIKIGGIVQGVGYRAFAQRKASQLGITGFARNLPDGSVEVLAQGDSELLRRLVEYLHEGPSLASIDNIEIAKRAPSSLYKEFRIGW